MDKISLIKKQECFEFEKPFAEPDVRWNSNEKYYTERIQKEDGEVVWFGIGKNWKKIPNKGWHVLGDDYNVLPKEIYIRDDGRIDGFSFPEGRTIWIKCPDPIYEKMYLKLQKNE